MDQRISRETFKYFVLKDSERTTYNLWDAVKAMQREDVHSTEYIYQKRRKI